MKYTLTHSRQKGFTMIELVLYVSLMGIFLLSLAFFLTAIFESREKNQIMAEVEQQ
jgi:type II secretory pathway pseudopilin PulG